MYIVLETNNESFLAEYFRDKNKAFVLFEYAQDGADFIKDKSNMRLLKISPLFNINLGE